MPIKRRNKNTRTKRGGRSKEGGRKGEEDPLKD